MKVDSLGSGSLRGYRAGFGVYMNKSLLSPVPLGHSIGESPQSNLSIKTAQGTKKCSLYRQVAS